MLEMTNILPIIYNLCHGTVQISHPFPSGELVLYQMDGSIDCLCASVRFIPLMYFQEILHISENMLYVFFRYDKDSIIGETVEGFSWQISNS